MIDDFKEKLEYYLVEETLRSAVIEKLVPLAGGASRDSWMFEARLDGLLEKLVLRMDHATQMNDDALTRKQEFEVMQSAHEHGVKVARVRWQEDELEWLGQPFFIMNYVGGISIGRKVMKLEAARQALPEQMAEQLAKIHTLSKPDFLKTISPQTALDNTYSVLDELEAKIPAFEFALRWAQKHIPDTDSNTFLHGDFRIGNLLVDQSGLTAVIDWEFAHIGDIHEELGYLCMRDWRFGNDHLHAAGLCHRERFIQAYEQHSDTTVNRDAVDWWEIVGNIRWGVICLVQANRHLSGADPSVELASLGRRSAEMQMEALRLIEKSEFKRTSINP